MGSFFNGQSKFIEAIFTIVSSIRPLTFHPKLEFLLEKSRPKIAVQRSCVLITNQNLEGQNVHEVSSNWHKRKCRIKPILVRVTLVVLLRLARIVSCTLEISKNTVAPVMKSHEGSEDLKRYLTHYEDVVRHLERTHLQQTNKLNDDLSSTLCQVNFPF